MRLNGLAMLRMLPTKLWIDGKRKEAAERVPDAMVTQFQALGDRAMVTERLRKYRDAGVTTLKLGLTAQGQLVRPVMNCWNKLLISQGTLMKLYMVPLAPNPTKVMLYIAEREAARCAYGH